MKKLVLFVAVFGSLSIQAQKVTGYWYGQANVEMAGIQNNYLTELIISQKEQGEGLFRLLFQRRLSEFCGKRDF
ncbi:MAG: hypothetical protein WDM78_07025 [Puia sp.]